jgi:hypothetical protein
VSEGKQSPPLIVEDVEKAEVVEPTPKAEKPSSVGFFAACFGGKKAKPDKLPTQQVAPDQSLNSFLQH